MKNCPPLRQGTLDNQDPTMPISAEDVDRAVADEAEMQGELAAQEGALAPVAPLPAVKMELADFHGRHQIPKNG